MACGGTTRSPGFRRRLAHCSKAVAAIACLIVALTAPSLGAPSAPAPVKTTLTVTTKDGYARLVFSAGEYIDGSARQAGNVLIISFKQPLDVSVNRVAEQAPDYIGAARRDPDGKSVRMALAQNVTIHAMSAGEKFFVDLLPTNWSGMPPGLPQDVVDELARRAREAETLLERQRAAVQTKKTAPIRVHVASQPTFTRYVFAVTGETGGIGRSHQGPAGAEFRFAAHFRSWRCPGRVAENGAGNLQRIGPGFLAGSFHSRRQCRHAHVPRRVRLRRRRGQSAEPIADADAGSPANRAGANAAKQGAARRGRRVPSLADAAAKISAAAAAPALRRRPRRSSR